MDANNSELEKKLRRYRSDLAVCGKGYILFGFWSVIKVFLTTYGNMDKINQMYGQAEAQGISKTVQTIAFIVFLLIMLSVIMLVHFWIGLGAICLSRGKKKSMIYMFMVGFFMLTNLLAIPGYFFNTGQAAETVNDTSIAALMVDMTVTFILFDIIYCTAKIRKLQKQTKEHSSGI
ncbi:MAG: hypothetical protein J5842_03175 [Lachnospiraceae bacterium]|nr:hypothetical protein [Lachnospiraceae bacterium]